MIEVPKEEIEKAANKYFGDPGGNLDLDQRPTWRAAVKWVLEYLNAPKHKQGNAFVIVVDRLKSARWESGEMQIWLSGDQCFALEVLKNNSPHNATEVIKAFLEKRCGEKFHDTNHLLNSFKKFWPTYSPGKQYGQKISRAHDDYFS